MKPEYLYMAVAGALIWGGVWAAFLQYTQWGIFLANRRTWLTVVVGIGVDLLIAYFVMTPEEWLKVVMIITASALLIIIRSLHNEKEELLRQINEYGQVERRED